MKTTRKILALALAVMLVLSLALNVSAVYDNVTYNGAEYYCTLRCEANDTNTTYEAFGKTDTTSTTALVGVYVAIYNGNVCLGTGSCLNARLSASTTVTSSRVATRAASEHYSDGVIVYTASAYVG